MQFFYLLWLADCAEKQGTWSTNLPVMLAPDTSVLTTIYSLHLHLLCDKLFPSSCLIKPPVCGNFPHTAGCTHIIFHRLLIQSIASWYRAVRWYIRKYPATENTVQTSSRSNSPNTPETVIILQTYMLGTASSRVTRKYRAWSPKNSPNFPLQ